MMSSITKLLAKLSMPWRWFRTSHPPDPDEDNVGDQEFYATESTSILDWVERIVIGIPSWGLERFLRWRQSRQPEDHERQPGVGSAVEWWLISCFEYVAERLEFLLDFFEYVGSSAMSYVVGMFSLPQKKTITSDATYGEADDDDAFLKPSSRLSIWLGRCSEVLDVIWFFITSRTSEFTDAFEWFMEKSFGVVSTIFLPWKWFKRHKSQDTSEDLGDDPESTIGHEVESTAKTDIFEIPVYIVFGLFSVLIYPLRRLAPIVERLLPRRFFWPLYWCLDLAFMHLEFLGDWWSTRNFRKLTTSAPALALAVPLLVFMSLVSRYTDGQKTLHYEIALHEAQKAEDLETAALLRQKLEQLGYRKMENIHFKDALDLAEKGDFQAAYEVMKLLATPEKPGLFLAHLWICSALLDQHIEEPNGWTLIEQHVRQAMMVNPHHVLLKRLNVELALHRNEMDVAVREMEEIVSEFPDLHATLAFAYDRLENRVKAAFHAQRTIEFFHTIRGSLAPTSNTNRPRSDGAESPSTTFAEPQSELVNQSSDQLTPNGYLRLAEAYGLLGDDLKKLLLLEEAVSVYPQEDTFAATIESSVEAALEAVFSESNPVARPVDLIESIVRLSPGNETLENNMSRFAAGHVGTREMFEHLESKGLATAGMYEKIGDGYMFLEDYSNALPYYEKSLELDMTSSFAWNNAAWIMGNHPPFQLEAALEAANRAIELSRDARFMETRGQILVKLGRWQEASQDLEHAINGSVPNSNEAHRSLVVAYEALGLKELAEAHRTLVRQD